MQGLRNTIRNPRLNRKCPVLIQNGYFLNYQPTPWRQALLEKKPGVLLLKNFVEPKCSLSIHKQRPPPLPDLGQTNPVHITSSLFGPNIVLNNLFSNTPSLCSFLNVGYRVLHPYRQNSSFVYSNLYVFRQKTR
jgi:hypothetical protein